MRLRPKAALVITGLVLSIAAQVIKRPFAHEGRNESNTVIEAMAAYVAAQSDG